MKLKLLFNLFLIQFELYSCFIDIGYLGYAVVGSISYYAYNQRCKYVECCEIKDKDNVYHNLKNKLNRNVFGQPILLDVLPHAITSHIRKENPSNPLVISFHGWTGSGKTYTSQLVAETLFEKGLKSIFVKKITPASFFPNPNNLNEYKVNFHFYFIFICYLIYFSFANLI